MRATIFSTYPPRACGLATFARDLRRGLLQADVEVDVIASVRETDAPGRRPEVALEVVQDVRAGYAQAGRAVAADVLSVQHEFGIFGGSEGLFVLEAMRAARCPVVTTLHTVLPTPPGHYHRALVQVADASDRLVVMTDTARDLLERVYGVAPSRVAVVPHGTPVMPEPRAGLRASLGLEGRTVLLTFGLLGPSKGIEFAIESLQAVIRDRPDALYVVLGATHPEVVKREGEAYRESLEAEVAALGLAGHVRFVDRYVDGDELVSWLQASDVYVSPYPGMDQICSGTLANALAAGLPVVSTPYLHAAEVLAGGAGLLAPYGDAEAFGAALRTMATDAGARAEAGAAAAAFGASTSWPETGRAYRAVFEDVVASHAAPSAPPSRPFRVHPGALPAAADALAALTDDVAPIQHAAYGVPDRRHGYSADDAARALVAVYGTALRLDEPDAELARVAQTSLAFLLHAQRPDGTFHNFMDYGRRFSDTVGSEDTTGRALWGLGATAAWAGDEPARALALEVAARSAGVRLRHPRAAAYAAVGFDLVLDAEPDHDGARRAALAHARRLAESFDAASADGWRWVSDSLTYSNAIVPHALLRASRRFEDAALRSAGLEAAAFLLDETVSGDAFDPVGNDGWLTRDGHHAAFDQQPIEAGYAAWFWTQDAAALAASEPALASRLARGARLAVEWLYGRNRGGEALFDEATGACFDGLSPQGVNRNQGAESVISGVLAHLAAFDLGLVAEQGRSPSLERLL